jgi:hypothetical protein
MQKHVNTDEMQVNANEPLGPLIVFQREIIFTQVKTCLVQVTDRQLALMISQ